MRKGKLVFIPKWMTYAESHFIITNILVLLICIQKHLNHNSKASNYMRNTPEINMTITRFSEVPPDTPPRAKQV